MWIAVGTSPLVYKNSPLSQRFFAVVALRVDVCMLVFEILLNACIKVVECLHGNRFEDKEWFVGRALKSLERDQGVNLYIQNLDVHLTMRN
jgi:hypothetical protein